MGTRVRENKARRSTNDDWNSGTSALVPAFKEDGRLKESYPWTTTPSDILSVRKINQSIVV